MAVLAQDLEVASLQAELERDHVARWCDTVETLTTLVGGGDINVVVLCVSDRNAVGIADTVVRVRAQFSRIPIVLWADPAPDTFQHMPAALRAGVFDVAIRGYDRLGTLIRAVTAPGWQPAASIDLLQVMAPMVPLGLLKFSVVCAIKASPRLTLTTVAAWLRTKKRTLRDRLQRAGLKPPSVFFDYATAVHSGCLLARHGFDVDDVMERMAFRDRRALNKLLREYTGRLASDLREHGQFSALLKRAPTTLQAGPDRKVKRPRLDRDVMDHYLTDTLTAGERLRYERWLVNAPAEVAAELEQLRRIVSGGRDPREVERRKRAVWERLQRLLG